MGDFSAAAQWAGNFYQVRFGLVKLLELKDPQAELFVEAADDVVATVPGAVGHYQTKFHHKSSAGTLTDKSVELWKTLRIWSGLITSFHNSNASFHFITTASAPAGSAASLLGETDRDEKKALALLEEAANTSTNSETGEARAAFQILKPADKERLLKSTFILPNSENLEALDRRIENSLYYAVPRKFIASATKRIKQWWLQRVEDAVIQMAESGNPVPISGADLHDYILTLNEQLSVENLPDDYGDKSPSSASYCFDDKKYFAQQIQLCSNNPLLLESAAHEYWRAKEQRGQWALEGLLRPGELSDYDKRLRNNWHLKRGYIWKTVTDNDEEKKKDMGLELLEKLQSNHIPIRLRFSNEYIMRGTYHILSNDLEIGWHPDWEKLKLKDKKP